MGGKREKTHSVKYQGAQLLIEMFEAGYGKSKHEEKKKNRDEIGRSVPAKNTLHCSCTFENYQRSWRYFYESMQKDDFKVNGHRPKTLDEAKEYLLPYLNKLWARYLAGELAAGTVNTYFSGPRKVFGVSSLDVDENGNRIYVLPERTRDDFKKSRTSVKTDKRVSLKNNAELIEFCRATGLRKEKELEALRGTDLVQHKNGKWYVHVKRGKGGKARDTEICGTSDQIKAVVDRMKEAGSDRVWTKVPDALDVHNLRAEYATRMYEKYKRPLSELSKKEKYFCRGGYKGIVFDRRALKIVSVNLGHGRIDVVPRDYAYLFPDVLAKLEDPAEGGKNS